MNLNRSPISKLGHSNSDSDLHHSLRKDSFQIIRDYETFSPQPPIGQNLSKQKYQNMGEMNNKNVDNDFRINAHQDQNEKFMKQINRNQSANFGLNLISEQEKGNLEINPSLDLTNLMRFLKSNQNGIQLTLQSVENTARASTTATSIYSQQTTNFNRNSLNPVSNNLDNLQQNLTPPIMKLEDNNKLSEQFFKLLGNENSGSLTKESLKSLDNMIQQISFSQLERMKQPAGKLKFKTEDEFSQVDKRRESLKRNQEKILSKEPTHSNETENNTKRGIITKEELKVNLETLNFEDGRGQEFLKRIIELNSQGIITNTDFQLLLLKCLCNSQNMTVVPKNTQQIDEKIGQDRKSQLLNSLKEGENFNLEQVANKESSNYNDNMEEMISSIRLRTQRETQYDSIIPDTERSRDVVTTNYGGVSDLESLQRETERCLPTQRTNAERKSENGYIFSDDLRYENTADSGNTKIQNYSLDQVLTDRDQNQGIELNLEKLTNIYEMGRKGQITTERLLRFEGYKNLTPSYQHLSSRDSRRNSNNFTLGYNSKGMSDRLSFANKESESSVQSKPLSYLDLDRYNTHTDSNRTLLENDIEKIDLRKLESNFDLMNQRGPKMNYFSRKMFQQNPKQILEETSFNISPETKQRAQQIPRITKNGELLECESLEPVDINLLHGVQELPSVFTSIKESDREYISNVGPINTVVFNMNQTTYELSNVKREQSALLEQNSGSLLNGDQEKSQEYEEYSVNMEKTKKSFCLIGKVTPKKHNGYAKSSRCYRELSPNQKKKWKDSRKTSPIENAKTPFSHRSDNEETTAYSPEKEETFKGYPTAKKQFPTIKQSNTERDDESLKVNRIKFNSKGVKISKKLVNLLFQESRKQNIIIVKTPNKIAKTPQKSSLNAPYSIRRKNLDPVTPLNNSKIESYRVFDKKKELAESSIFDSLLLNYPNTHRERFHDSYISERRPQTGRIIGEGVPVLKEKRLLPHTPIKKGVVVVDDFNSKYYKVNYDGHYKASTVGNYNCKVIKNISQRLFQHMTPIKSKRLVVNMNNGKRSITVSENIPLFRNYRSDLKISSTNNSFVSHKQLKDQPQKLKVQSLRNSVSFSGNDLNINQKRAMSSKFTRTNHSDKKGIFNFVTAHPIQHHRPLTSRPIILQSQPKRLGSLTTRTPHRETYFLIPKKEERSAILKSLEQKSDKAQTVKTSRTPIVESKKIIIRSSNATPVSVYKNTKSITPVRATLLREAPITTSVFNNKSQGISQVIRNSRNRNLFDLSQLKVNQPIGGNESRCSSKRVLISNQSQNNQIIRKTPVKEVINLKKEKKLSTPTLYTKKVLLGDLQKTPNKKYPRVSENQETKKKSPINPLHKSLSKIQPKFNQVSEETLHHPKQQLWSYRSETEEDNPLMKYYKDSNLSRVQQKDKAVSNPRQKSKLTQKLNKRFTNDNPPHLFPRESNRSSITRESSAKPFSSLSNLARRRSTFQNQDKNKENLFPQRDTKKVHIQKTPQGKKSNILKMGMRNGTSNVRIGASLVSRNPRLTSKLTPQRKSVIRNLSRGREIGKGIKMAKGIRR